MLLDSEIYRFIILKFVFSTNDIHVIFCSKWQN